MSLNTNIPQPTQSLGQTNNLILQNFNSIESAFIVNHVDYNTTGAGKHNFVTMPEQSQSPGTLISEMALFCMQDTNSVLQLWIQQPNQSAAGPAINFTGSVINTSNDTTTLPSGVVLKWGNTVTSGGTATVVFTTAFATATYAAFATASSSTGTVNITALSTTEFTATSSNPAVAFYWCVIGS